MLRIHIFVNIFFLIQEKMFLKELKNISDQKFSD